MRYLGTKIAILSVILSAAFAEVAAGMEPIKSDQVMIDLRAGHNAVLGSFTAFALQTQQIFGDDSRLDTGVQYNTLGKIALEARQSYDIHFDWGELLPETIVTYSNLSSINSLSIGAGAKAYFGRLSAKLGYYYRLYGNKSGKISEPFTIPKQEWASKHQPRTCPQYAFLNLLGVLFCLLYRYAHCRTLKKYN